MTTKSKQENIFKCKIGQISIQSGSDDFRVNFILEQLNNANFDIVSIQETNIISMIILVRIISLSLKYGIHDLSHIYLSLFIQKYDIVLVKIIWRIALSDRYKLKLKETKEN